MSAKGRESPWLRRQRRDLYVRRARQESWRSRAVYKLMDIDRAHGLVRGGDIVVDLGAAPGSWSQYLARRAALVIACDLRAMEPIDGVEFVSGDFTDPGVQARIAETAGGGVDLLVSDSAPAISGVSEADQGAMATLIEGTITLASRYLKPGGLVLMKVLQGSQTQALWGHYKSAFTSIRAIKPAASRAQSRETYWLAQPDLDEGSGR